MSSKYYSLSWNSYQSGICKGFAEQQNKQEFVDMTLVADGHLVKVHKNLICLASSLIKSIIKSTPCEHPIIFLNNVSHETLCCLLEYIYTGEVKVESDKLRTVLRVANKLKLCGLETFNKEKPTSQFSEAKQISGNPVKSTGDNPGIVVPTQVSGRPENAMLNNENICQYTNEYQPEVMTTDCYDNSPELDPSSAALGVENGFYSIYDVGETVAFEATSADLPPATELPTNLQVTNITIDTTGSLPQQYSVSSRGRLQLLLNRFVYNLHHEAQCGRRRRWRCADYRRRRCSAYVDTLDDVITTRRNIHHHEYHDDVILKKTRKNCVFGSSDNASGARLTRVPVIAGATSTTDDELL
ncbi:uncharacterized protein LOC121737833 [Aricia agestis]|uniref:uncharacterized protein LOC121737833 n=1 Tax=Aricia agestis TaxID=91739 RepID=UPI001C205139|nr:uncharacterized protein LOC121737833 [Aricia agestis]